MKRPEMIIFDYGHTLLYEPQFDFLKGEKAVFKYIKNNPQNVTPKEACAYGNKLFEGFRECSKLGFELHEWQMLKMKYDRLGITFSIPMEEVEDILWSNTSEGAKMPYAEEMLQYLSEQRIRTAVISNICWSGKALENRINRLLPQNQFEFILASSEYGVRKPNALLFEIALQKAGLKASQVWYCGDNVKADVYGAHNVGIFPVLYEGVNGEAEAFEKKKEALPIEFEHLNICHWRELIDVLENTTFLGNVPI